MLFRPVDDNAANDGDVFEHVCCVFCTRWTGGDTIGHVIIDGDVVQELGVQMRGGNAALRLEMHRYLLRV